jgi:hypothetical protein
MDLIQDVIIFDYLNFINSSEYHNVLTGILPPHATVVQYVLVPSCLCHCSLSDYTLLMAYASVKGHEAPNHGFLSSATD